MDINNSNRELIVYFGGGVGNQLFSYALYSLLREQGKNVTADLSHYVNSNRKFELREIFGEGAVRECDYKLKEKYISDEQYYYDELISRRNENMIYDSSILDMQEGYIHGYYQTHLYASQIADKLRDLLIPKKEIIELIDCLADRYVLSDDACLHIRRGDYLSVKNKKLYGGICEANYYRRAIRNIREGNNMGKLYVFSDDYNWLLENSNKYGFSYIDRAAVSEYKDYYDLFLMSKFRYQIISNSTFSWWSAWINPDPIEIIAPDRWVNGWNIEDIIPNEWRKISNVIC